MLFAQPGQRAFVPGLGGIGAGHEHNVQGGGVGEVGVVVRELYLEVRGEGNDGVGGEVADVGDADFGGVAGDGGDGKEVGEGEEVGAGEDAEDVDAGGVADG